MQVDRCHVQIVRHLQWMGELSAAAGKVARRALGSRVDLHRLKRFSPPGSQLIRQRSKGRFWITRPPGPDRIYERKLGMGSQCERLEDSGANQAPQMTLCA